MGRKQILISLIALVIASIIFAIYFFRGNDENVRETQNLEHGEEMVIIGLLPYYSEGELVSSVRHEEENYTIFLDNALQGIKSGDFVKAEGFWSWEDSALITDNVRVLNEEEKLEYLRKRSPILEIDIIDYPDTVEHTCITPKFRLKLTNIGEKVITHRDIHNSGYDYGFYYFLNNDWYRANVDRDDYDEIGDYKSFELFLNQGFKYFEDIHPEESIEVDYWGGGELRRTAGGLSGTDNIFGYQESGEITFSFAWADKNRYHTYSPIFIFETEPVTIKLLNDECELNF